MFRVIVKEFKHVLPPTIFFAVGFNLIVLTRRLLLHDYLIQLAGFVVATTSALIVGKAVLVADKLPLLGRFDRAPLIQPILFKTVVYWAAVFIARLLEAYLHFIFDGWYLGGFFRVIAEHFEWHRFLAIQIWILVLFLIYVTAAELNELFGDGELFRIMFTRRSSELKLTRRQRIRALVRLAKLTEGHSVAELRDPTGTPYQEMASLITQLAKDGEARRPVARAANPNVAGR